MKYLKRIILLVALEIISINGFATSVWNQKPNFPGVGRHRGTGIAIGDKGYVGLGHMNGTGVNIVYSDWWEYDPATSSWTQKSDYPALTYGNAAFATKTAGYVGGGVFQDDEFFKFDPITNTWTAIADAPVNVGDNMAFCIGKYGYITTGSTLYEYNTEDDTWAQKQNPPSNINTWSSACTVQNSAYVKTGSNFYEYKPTSDSWIVKTSYPGLASSGGVAFSVDNKCYFLLGYSGSLGNVMKEMWEYDPATNNWTLQPEFPGTSRRFSSAFTINNKGYVAIGTNGINFSDFWEYNRILNISETNPFYDAISLYPCPASDYITFDLTQITNIESVEILIYSIDGKIIKEINSADNKVTLYRNELSSGQFIYTVKQKNVLLKNGQFILY
ncbi:MAG: T9SS type A sorting domain-containing protein [Crocinitomicaceae bacterium]